MDKSHRDRVAFVRICSGRFERGMVLTHDATGRPFATKYAQAMFGRDRSTIEEAFPGDIVGLVNATALRPGDTLWAEDPVTFPTIPSFAPEHFSVCRVADMSKTKQFRKGIEQLDSEGVIQVLSSDLRGDQAPVLAAVGPLQFEVVSARLADEFGAPVKLDRLDYTDRPAHRRRRRRDPQGRGRHRGADPPDRRRAPRALPAQVAPAGRGAEQPGPAARAAGGRHALSGTRQAGSRRGGSASLIVLLVVSGSGTSTTIRWYGSPRR